MMLLSTMTNIHQTYRHTMREYAYPIEESLEYIARAGFPAADLSLISVCAHGNILGTDRWRTFVDSCGEALARTGLIPCQANAFYSQDRDVAIGMDEFQRDWIFTARTISVAAELGAPWVTVHPVYGARLPGMDTEEVFAFMDTNVEKEAVWAVLNKLNEKEKQIVKLRFGLGEEKERTQKEVADMLNISQSYISRIEKKILTKMKKGISKQL